MVEQVSLTINLCQSTTQTAGNPGFPSIIMSVFLLFLYLNNATSLAPKSKEDLLVRFKDAYNNRRLFINTEGTCASNAYLFLGAQTKAQHIEKNKHLGNRDALIGDKVYTQWLIYKYREIPAIAEFAETHKTNTEYNAYASTLAMYFIQHLETLLDSLSSEPFFTYMGFSSKQQSMTSHAVVVWYNPRDKHIFIINPQDFMEDGRIIYGAGEHWRNYFGAGLRHYSLHKYVEDNMDFFAGLGKVSLLTEFHTDAPQTFIGDAIQTLKGGQPPTITLPNGDTYPATILESQNKHIALPLSNGSVLSVIETRDKSQYMLIKLSNGNVYQAAMFDSGTVIPVISHNNKFIPCIINADNTVTPAILLQDETLFAATLIDNNYVLPVRHSDDKLVYTLPTTLNVVLPAHLQTTFVANKIGYDQYSDELIKHRIYYFVNPITNHKQYVAFHPDTHYVFVTDRDDNKYFTWLTPTNFEDNKLAIDVAVNMVYANTSVSQIDTFKFAEDVVESDLRGVEPRIAQLNQILSVVCKEARLDIGHVYDMQATTFYTFNNIDEIIATQDIVLCLNIGSKCVSSLTLRYADNVATIDAFTKQELQGKLYNKLLRAVAVMVLPYIYPNATVLRSVAVNYLSAYQMMKYFGGVVADDDATINAEFAESLGRKPLSNAGLEDVMHYLKHSASINVVIDVHINAENQSKASKVFDDVITDFDRFMC